MGEGFSLLPPPFFFQILLLLLGGGGLRRRHNFFISLPNWWIVQIIINDLIPKLTFSGLFIILPNLIYKGKKINWAVQNLTEKVLALQYKMSFS